MKSVPLHRYVVSLVCVAIISGGSVAIWNEHHETVQSSTENDLEKVHKLYDEIQENYYQKVDKNELIDGALKGMTEAVGDPYTTYLSESEAKELNQSLADSFEGIGASLTLKEEYPVIAAAPIKGSPAEEKGLKAEDQILEVDGKSTKGQELSEVVNQIRGKKGTTVSLTIKRNSQTFTVEITRGTIPQETVSSEIAEDHQEIGVIAISTFGEGTSAELKKAIVSLREQGAKSFVIDVRQNPGGLLDQVQIMASMFLKDGRSIVKFASDDKFVSETVASSTLDDGFKVTEPVAVLVDGQSASAAEIFAAALKESADIPVIGTQTFGKGTVQNVNELGDQSELKMTVLKWLTPNEEWLNEKGLTPTYVAGLPDYAYLSPLPRDTTMKKGDSSEAVDVLNQFLQALAYQTSGDQFTEDTEAAVKAFQEKNQLNVTGEVDSKTAQVLEQAIVSKIKEEDQAYSKAIEVLTTDSN